jgi:hypothetical protein
MARKKTISDDIRQQIIARVEAFNQANTRPAEPSGMARLLQRLGVLPPTADTLPPGSYVPRFRGSYLYLDRINYWGQPTQICRLKWTGDIDKWEFAIFRHSREFYDPDEWFFPGAGEVDGTVEGAMRAGMEAYPL